MAVDIAVTDGGAIEGRVENVPAAMAGQVWVIAFDATILRREALVSADGTFRLEDLPPGRYGLKAGHDAYTDPHVPRWKAGENARPEGLREAGRAMARGGRRDRRAGQDGTRGGRRFPPAGTAGRTIEQPDREQPLTNHVRAKMFARPDRETQSDKRVLSRDPPSEFRSCRSPDLLIPTGSSRLKLIP